MMKAPMAHRPALLRVGSRAHLIMRPQSAQQVSDTQYELRPPGVFYPIADDNSCRRTEAIVLPTLAGAPLFWRHRT